MESLIKKLSATRLGRLSLATLTSSEIARFRDERIKQGAAAQTAKHDLSLLSRVFNTASKEWGIALPHGNIESAPRRCVFSRASFGRYR
ncbi:MAG: hypothetical protein ACYCP0_05215 [Acidiferrobacteraceae bacterium]